MLAALFAVSAWSGPARADDVDTCVSASETGQELRDQGKLRAARALFVTCAAAECPALVQKDCAAWLTAVDDKLPSVSVHARDADGRDLGEVRVVLDGETLAERLDGRAIAVDPGSHTLRFVTPGAPEVRQTLLLREGEKGRLVDVRFGDSGATAAKERPFSVPTAAWVLGGLSLVGFGALAGFGVSAKSAVDDMRATCAPGCTPSRVDEARRDLILANVGFGLGVAALGAAAIVVLVQNTGAAPKRAAASWQLTAGARGVALSRSW